MTVRQRRGVLLALLVVGVGAATMLALSAFQKNLLFFFSPSQVLAGEAPVGYPFRLGGLVAEGSVERGEGLVIRFALTDGAATIPVIYKGLLPDLFREGQGVVTRGRLTESGVFRAEQVLAKHDEQYMPPAVADALKAAATKGGKP